MKFKSRFTLHTIPKSVNGNFILSKKSDLIEIDLDIPSIAEGNLKVGISYNSPFTGELKFSNIQINQYLGRFPSINDAINEGYFTANLLISGTTNQQICSKVTFIDGVIN